MSLSITSFNRIFNFLKDFFFTKSLTRGESGSFKHMKSKKKKKKKKNIPLKKNT